MKSFIDNFVDIFPNIILNKVDYKENYIPKYLGLSKNHEKNIEKIISDYYEKLRIFYGVPALNNILQQIKRSCENLIKLSKNTPTFVTIKINTENGKDNTELKPIFDERTSKFLYEYYLLKVLNEYVRLSNQENMLVRGVQYKNIIDNQDIFSVDYLEETNTIIDTNVVIDSREEIDTNLLSGDKKELKQKVANLLIEFLRVMDSYKDVVDISYEKIQDKIFKLKEKEKDTITDRLKEMTDEERDADTILKINKLGMWSKGLQKGLTTYVKETYDEEREFMEKMLQYEKKAQKTMRVANVGDVGFDDFIEDQEREQEIEREAYDMTGYTEDFMDGVFEGDDVDNDHYDDYDS
jgi:ferritin